MTRIVISGDKVEFTCGLLDFCQKIVEDLYCFYWWLRTIKDISTDQQIVDMLLFYIF